MFLFPVFSWLLGVLVARIHILAGFFGIKNINKKWIVLCRYPTKDIFDRRNVQTCVTGKQIKQLDKFDA